MNTCYRLIHISKHHSRLYVQSGFTLIEVLIAALIMFMAITAFFSIFQGAILSSQKAEKSLYVAEVAQSIRAQINENLNFNQAASPLKGEGSFADADFSWVAIPVAVGRPAHPDNLPISVISQARGKGGTTVMLWHIETTIEMENYQRQYDYYHMSW